MYVKLIFYAEFVKKKKNLKPQLYLNASSYSLGLFIVLCRLIKFNLSHGFIITSSELFRTGLSRMSRNQAWGREAGLPPLVYRGGEHGSLDSTSDRLQTQHRLFQQLQCNKLPPLAPEQNAQQGRIHLAAYKLIEMQGGRSGICTVYPHQWN